MRLRFILPLMLLAAALAACESAPTAPVQSLKLVIAEAGLYRLVPGDLPAGFNLSAANLAQLHLTHKGVEIPIDVAQRDNSSEVIFYAAPAESIYSASDVYWLTYTGASGARIQTRAVEPARDGAVAETVETMLKLEEDKIYFPTAIGGVHWFWDSLTAPTRKTFSANVSSFERGDAQIQISLAGATQGEHHIQVSLNAQLIGEAVWNGQVPKVFQTTATNLRATDNQITLAATTDSGRADVIFLDSMTITYPREFSAVNDLFAFAGGAQNYRVRGFHGDTLALYDVTDSRAAQKLSGWQTAPDGVTQTMTFHDNLPNRRYVALAPTAYKKPFAIRAAQPNTLRAQDQRADYLVIAPSEFRNALEPLLKHRAENGLAAKFVDIEQIYDAFSDGVPDPHALRNFLRFTQTQWGAPAPRFALLVGKASYDYRDNLKGPNKSLVPAFLTPTPHLGEAASDDWFAQPDDQAFHPTLAIGRIPAKTPAQVSVAVRKIIAYDSMQSAIGWRRQAVFVTDNLETSFDVRADDLANDLPRGINLQKVYLSQYNGDLAAARAELIKQWNVGAQLLMYMGHGSINLWAAGPLFSDDDIGAIKNGERLPILLTPTCLDGFFYHPQKDSLTEELLFKTDGGIVAGLAPTGLSLQPPQDALMKELFAELFARPAPTVGEAIWNAKRKVAASLANANDAADADDTREVLDTFVLLGDPALKWELPQ